MNTRITRAGIIIYVLMAFVVVLTGCSKSKSTPSTSTIEEITICKYAYDQGIPDVSNDTIVWADTRNGNVDIYGYNIDTNETIPIQTAEGFQKISPAISGDIVVWEDYRNGTFDPYMSNSDIYGYNLASDTEFAICDDPSMQWLPAISENRITWIDYFNESASFSGYDMSTNNNFLIHVSPTLCSITGTKISEDIIVWTDCRNGNDDIYGYDLQTNTEFSVCLEQGNQSYPAISGDIVVWEDDRNGNADIFGYNLKDKTEFSICTLTSDQEYPDVSGNIVVWEDRRNWTSSERDIYAYDLGINKEFAVCTNLSSQISPAVSGDLIVWEDWRNGNADIYGARIK